MLQCVAVCCSVLCGPNESPGLRRVCVLQCVAVHDSVLQCMSVRCSVLQCSVRPNESPG